MSLPSWKSWARTQWRGMRHAPGCGRQGWTWAMLLWSTSGASRRPSPAQLFTGRAPPSLTTS
eukprot:781904-Alexandrium_andersonii.AAC.1